MIYSLSIIMTLHKEGAIAEKSINNIRLSINYAMKKKIWKHIEVIVILDNADKETKLAVSKFTDVINILESVDYKEPSSSRNHGVKCSSCDFVFFVDGDDLFAKESIFAIGNTINNFYDVPEKIIFKGNYEDHIAIFPSNYIEFPEIYVQKFCDSNDIIKQNMLFHHSYVARICCLRDILLENPVRKNVKPYGYEDWDLNNRLLSRGLSFKVANGHDVFYRKKTTNSVLTQHIQEKCIVRNSNLYLICSKNNESANFNVKSPYSDSRLTMFQSLKKTLGYYPNELQNLKLEYFKYADFLIRSNEKNLSVNKYIDGSYSINASYVFNETLSYFELRDFLTGADIIFFIPWITIGGADRLVVEYINVLVEAGVSVKVVTTIKSGERINLIKCSHLNIGNDNLKWATITEENLLHILLKAIVNSNVKSLHIINSEPILKIVQHYSLILKEYNINYLVTFFGLDIDLNNRSQYIGFPVWYTAVYNNAKCIIGDNSYWYQEYKKINNNIDFNYVKLFSPIIASQRYLPRKNRRLTNNILWASRICNQKMFKLFVKIVNNMPEKNFVIYGDNPVDEELQNLLQETQKLHNVRFMGTYGHINEIDLEEFDLYLYTALFDGIPTILLDMINNYLPIVSSDVGGISEVLGDGYSLLVKNVTEVKAYIDNINIFYENSNMFNEDIIKVRERMVSLHGFEKFQVDYLNLVKRYLFV